MQNIYKMERLFPLWVEIDKFNGFWKTWTGYMGGRLLEQSGLMLVCGVWVDRFKEQLLQDVLSVSNKYISLLLSYHHLTGLNMSESHNSPPPQLGTNSSSVAIAILVPFFALIFTGFGFYLYKQRYALKDKYRKNMFLSLHHLLHFCSPLPSFTLRLICENSTCLGGFDRWGANRHLSRCLLQSVLRNSSVWKVANWNFWFKHNWLVLALLTDANDACSDVNVYKKRLAEGISFAWADWNLARLPKKRSL